MFNGINSEFLFVSSCNIKAINSEEKIILFCVGDFVEGPVPVATRSKVWDCRRSLAWTEGSNPKEGMVV